MNEVFSPVDRPNPLCKGRKADDAGSGKRIKSYWTRRVNDTVNSDAPNSTLTQCPGYKCRGNGPEQLNALFTLHTKGVEEAR